MTRKILVFALITTFVVGFAFAQDANIAVLTEKALAQDQDITNITDLPGSTLEQSTDNSASRAYSNPSKFEAKVQNYEGMDKKNPPPDGAYACIGSSSMEGWHLTIRADLSPLPVIPRGISGSTFNEVVYFFNRLIANYKPKAVLLYSGENDICMGRSPIIVRDKFKEIVKLMDEKLPHAHLFVLSIKPSILRWDFWDKTQKANAMIKEICDENPKLTYIDITKGMLGKDGKPKPEIYKGDKLHMNDLGYRIWRDAVAPILLSYQEESL